jgi:anti-sigma-K factor RskA
MDIANKPDLLDRLAAHYSLGTLQGPARRRFEHHARQNATVRAQVLLWQERLNALTELAAPVAPSVALWPRIENALRAELAGFKSTAHQTSAALLTAGLAQARRALNWWRGLAVAGGAVALAGLVAFGVGLQHRQQLNTQLNQASAQLKAAQQLEYVAVLTDAQSGTSMSGASILVTFDARQSSLVVKRVGAYQEAANKSLQLWALPPGGAPQSLGVLGQTPVMRLATQSTQINTIPTLAVSLEPQGGVPSSTGPTGPVLFKGALLQI